MSSPRIRTTYGIFGFNRDGRMIKGSIATFGSKEEADKDLPNRRQEYAEVEGELRKAVKELSELKEQATFTELKVEREDVSEFDEGSASFQIVGILPSGGKLVIGSAFYDEGKANEALPTLEQWNKRIESLVKDAQGRFTTLSRKFEVKTLDVREIDLQGMAYDGATDSTPIATKDWVEAQAGHQKKIDEGATTAQ
ncbi:hypothetical protein KW786_02715 [Candidatus Parcubacteria bacterium]|nr:hypothetical protein [Candidatus Parcubacteria bacterium]